MAAKNYFPIADRGWGEILFEDVFSAILNQGRVNLIWVTLKEKNNAVFIVERTRDSVHFERVCTSQGIVDGSAIINYMETDFNPYPGISYYRLTALDSDGHSKRSGLVKVIYDIEKKEAPVTAVITNDNAKYAAEDSEEIVMMLKDREGRECSSKFIVSLKGDWYFAVDVEKKTKPGRYTVVAASNNRIYQKDIIVK